MTTFSPPFLPPIAVILFRNIPPYAHTHHPHTHHPTHMKNWTVVNLTNTAAAHEQYLATSNYHLTTRRSDIRPCVLCGKGNGHTMRVTTKVCKSSRCGVGCPFEQNVCLLAICQCILRSRNVGKGNHSGWVQLKSMYPLSKSRPPLDYLLPQP